MGVGCRVKWYVSMPKGTHRKHLWSPGACAAQSEALGRSPGEKQEAPRILWVTHLLGVQNLEEWEKQDRQEGGDGQRDDFCAPVNGHDDDGVGTPGSLKRQP